LSKNNGRERCGGVLRDSGGNWMCDFSKFLGSCSAYMADLWRVLKGLKLARSRGFTRIELWYVR